MDNDLKFGALIGVRETDYILGSSPVVKEILMSSLNWKEWTPEHEIQAQKYYDTLSCVTYSALDVLEYQFTYALHNGLISPENVLWLKTNGYFKNGYINFSERFTAILGGTSNIGAYQYMVADAIRKQGLIPQTMFDVSDDIKSQSEFLDKSKITKEMYDLGLEFIKRFPINYEWCDVKDGLKYSPVQVCVYYNDGENILCPTNNPQHAVLAVNIDEGFIELDDSYQRQFKKYCPQAVYSGMLYTIKFNNMIFKKQLGQSSIYLINEVNKTKTMIIDMETLTALNGNFTEGDLSSYKDAGTLVWTERIIN
jgi:hypothetical protein